MNGQLSDLSAKQPKNLLAETLAPRAVNQSKGRTRLEAFLLLGQEFLETGLAWLS